MIKPGQQFKIDSVEELKQAYKHLDFYYNLQIEIKDFKKKEMRYVQKKSDLSIMLYHFDEDFETIPNPFKKQTKMQELIENLKTVIESGSKYTDKHIEDFINNYISETPKVYDTGKTYFTPKGVINYLEENTPDIDTAMNDLHESAKDLGYKVTVTFESE